MSKLIDGKALSLSLKEQMRDRIVQLEAQYGRKPCLAVIIVGDNPASRSYVRGKIKAAEFTGMDSKLVELPEDVSQDGLLEVIGNRIASIKGIGSLNKLHTLRIGDNQLKDISPVGELNDLTYLGFGYNDIEDISVLYSLPMLHYLTMSGNRIRDISPVLEMKELKWLEVTGNPIEDESVFDNLPESVKHLEK